MSKKIYVLYMNSYNLGESGPRALNLSPHSTCIGMDTLSPKILGATLRYGQAPESSRWSSINRSVTLLHCTVEIHKVVLVLE